MKVEKNRPQAEFEEEREIMKGKEQGKRCSPLLFLTSQLIFGFANRLWPPGVKTSDSLVKTLMLGKIEGKRRRGRQRMG